MHENYCGHEVDTRAKKCPNCGKPNVLFSLVSAFRKNKEKKAKKKAIKNLRACPACGKYVSPRAKSCPNCGEPF